MEFAEMLLKFKPLWGAKRIQQWRLFYETRQEESERRFLHNLLTAKYITLFGELPEEGNQILLDPPPRKEAWGEYRLGDVYHGTVRLHPFGLREHEFIRNIIISGTPGSGKTNTAHLLAWHFLKKGKPFLVFDWKRSWRDLIATQEGQDILVFTVGSDISPFYFNPLIPPPGRKATEWLRVVVQIMGHAYFLGHGCFKILKDAIHTAYLDYQVYEKKVDVWPTMQTVLENIYGQSTSRKKSDWMDSTKRAVEWLCFPDVCYTINVPKAVPLEKLFDKPVILELDTLADWDKIFFTEAFLMWYYYYRLAQKKEREKFWHATIVEEAHHMFLRHKQESTGEETVTDRLIRMFREHNESMILIDQHPSLISIPALGDTYTTITHNLKHEYDVTAAGAAMLMPRATRKYLGKLDVGQAVVKLQGRHTSPFLIQVPPVQTNKGAVDDLTLRALVLKRGKEATPFAEIETENESPDDHSDTEASNDEISPKPELKGMISPGEGEKRVILADQNLVIIHESEEKLLLDINTHFSSGVRERYLRLHLSTYKGNQARDSLLERGLIEEVVIPDVTSGRRNLYQITEKGLQVLAGLGVEARNTWRKGGLEHQFYEFKLAQYAKDFGYKPIRSFALGGGKEVDIHLQKLPNIDDRPTHPILQEFPKIALEFETGKSNFITNITKCLEAGYDRIVSIGLNKSVEEKIRKDVETAGLLHEPKLVITNIRAFMQIEK